MHQSFDPQELGSYNWQNLSAGTDPADYFVSHGCYWKPLVLCVFCYQANFRRIILAEKTPLSSQYYQELQKFIVIERGLVLLPVASTVEAGRIMAQMVSTKKLSSEDQHHCYTRYLHFDPLSHKLINHLI